MTKIWNPFPPCLYLLDFGNPLHENFQYSTSTPHLPLTKPLNCVILYSFHATVISTYICHKKCSPNLIIPHVPLNANGINY